MTEELDEALGVVMSQEEYRNHDPLCPRCRSGNIQHSGDFREAYVLLYKWNCHECEYAWQDYFELKEWEPLD